MNKLKVKNLFPLLYPNQKIRIINFIKDIDTGVCLKYGTILHKYHDCNINKISIAGDVLRIEVEINDWFRIYKWTYKRNTNKY